jgi:hypothetical protein
MTSTVRNDVCLDVIVNGLVVNQTLFLQTVTGMEFLEHDQLVPPNDIALKQTLCSRIFSVLINID